MGTVGSSVGDDDVIEFGKARAAGEELLQLRRAADDYNLRAGVIQDVGHAVGRLVEIDRDGDAAGAGDGEIGGVPFRAIGGEQDLRDRRALRLVPQRPWKGRQRGGGVLPTRSAARDCRGGTFGRGGLGSESMALRNREGRVP